MKKFPITDKQIDALKELGGISTGHAAMALSQLIGRKINIAVTKVEVVPSQNFLNFFVENQNLMGVISFRLLGELQGGILLAFGREDMLKLSDLLLRRDERSERGISEMDQSALKEIANILSASYLTALSSVLGIQVVNSAPQWNYDAIKPLIQGLVCQLIKPDREAVSLVTEFVESNSQTRGILILLPNEESLKKILKGMKVDGENKKKSEL